MTDFLKVFGIALAIALAAVWFVALVLFIAVGYLYDEAEKGAEKLSLEQRETLEAKIAEVEREWGWFQVVVFPATEAGFAIGRAARWLRRRRV